MTKKYVVFPLLISLFLFSSCHKKSGVATDTGENDSILVITEKIGKSNVSNRLFLSGNIEGNKTVRLGFMVPGKINYFPVEEGQKVNSGQFLASLDPVDYTIAKNIADVQVEEATDQYERLRIMHDRNSVSDSDFKKVEFALKQARNEQALQAKNLSDTRLYAPFNGILLKKLAEKDEIVAQGLPVLVISDISKIKADIYVPENELSYIKIGETASVTIGALNKVYQGKITEVGSVADATSRAFTAKVELNNPDLLIRPGMIAEVNIDTGRSQEVLTLPIEALMKNMDGSSYVYVVDREKQKAFRRKIVPGPVTANRIEVISGLREGEEVVIGGNQNLYDGAPVSLSH
ncbi:MAG: efflux RND transporter periplasmic adaptor subunit [Candidatus Azobacteroides sp.]|nr:efflux RND transporter periplasmic adaptor subunit [Candidatus Azobacteroides sp.]